METTKRVIWWLAFIVLCMLAFSGCAIWPELQYITGADEPAHECSKAGCDEPQGYFTILDGKPVSR